MKHSIVFLLVSLAVFNCKAQNNIYHINWKKDAWVVGAGIATLGIGYIVNNSADRATLEDINRLNKNDVNAFDRKAIDNYSMTAHKTSNILVYTALAMPITAFLSKKGCQEKIAIPVMGLEALAFSTGITSIVKATVKRYRPYTYNTALTTTERTNSGARKSFPSGHTCNAAVATFFAAKVLTDLYPNSKYKPLIWTAAVTIPALTGYMRYKAGKHFPTDVIAGYVIGASIGYLVPALHKSKQVSLTISSAGVPGVVVDF
jgi:membrane-associated phospholipid phosphatase